MAGRKNSCLTAALVAFFLAPIHSEVVAQDTPEFEYFPSGCLKIGSGKGVTDNTIYAESIAFPIHSDHKAYINSQVYNPGGGKAPSEGSQDQCYLSNYAYPWMDNFCETRSGRNRETLNCPSRAIHQGVDIRGGTPRTCTQLRNLPKPDRKLIKLVAVDSGVVSHVGSYSFNVRVGSRIYKYLHPNMSALEISRGQQVTKNTLVGYLSNDFSGPTTFHLHFEIKANLRGAGWKTVSPYKSLVRAYERSNGTGTQLRVSNSSPCKLP